MKRLWLVIMAAATVLAVGAFAACGSDGDSSAEESLQDVQRRNWGAYGCMPREVRRRFDRVSDQYEVRYEQVVARIPPGAERRAENEALFADRTAARLLRQLRRIILPYYPGGREYERQCYEREVERYDRRVGG